MVQQTSCCSWVFGVDFNILYCSFPPGDREVLVDRLAAEAVLKGAHVYAPGLLACSPGVAEGDLVAVAAALELPGK
jgi:predicted ribosome-associated RNA-binding protein Tma20